MQKNGCAPEEYEDAFAPSDEASMTTDRFTCAVADGATETSFSGLWAKILCQGFVEGETALQNMQENWLREVSKRELPWYAEQKLESGAYAAFVTLTLEEKGNKILWSSKALGDSCLFHIRDNKLLSSFPVKDWSEFNNSPLLLASRADRNEEALAAITEESGEAEKGDQFLLMSDAISNWFLREHAEGKPVLGMVGSFVQQAALNAICTDERARKLDDGRHAMPNDDVTAALVTLS